MKLCQAETTSGHGASIGDMSGCLCFHPSSLWGPEMRAQTEEVLPLGMRGVPSMLLSCFLRHQGSRLPTVTQSALPLLPSDALSLIPIHVSVIDPALAVTPCRPPAPSGAPKNPEVD